MVDKGNEKWTCDIATRSHSAVGLKLVEAARRLSSAARKNVQEADRTVSVRLPN